VDRSYYRFALYPMRMCCTLAVFFFNYLWPSRIYTLSLHDALPICCACVSVSQIRAVLSDDAVTTCRPSELNDALHTCSSCPLSRSEEHTSELQSRGHIVCRLLLEEKIYGH